MQATVANRPMHVCDTCFGPLVIRYDYDGIKQAISRNKITARPHHLWRFYELTPIDGEPLESCHSSTLQGAG